MQCKKILAFFLFFLCFRYVHYFFLFLQIWWNYQGQAWDCWELFNIRPLIPPIDLWMFINTYQIHGFSKIFQGAKVLKGTLHFRNNKDSLEPPSCKTISKNFWPEFQLQYLWNTFTNFLYLYLLCKIKMLRPVGGLYDPLQNL